MDPPKRSHLYLNTGLFTRDNQLYSECNTWRSVNYGNTDHHLSYGDINGKRHGGSIRHCITSYMSALLEGPNMITIFVTALDGITTNTYTVAAL